MDAQLKRCNIHDDASSPVKLAIVLTAPPGTPDALQDALEIAGFEIRVWGERELIVFAAKQK